jgi:hypothetical protein
VEIDLKLHKLNEAYIKFECEKHIAQELSIYFEFYVPGFQFTPAFKKKLWDGKIRLADLRTFTIYHGLVPYIQKFCEERNYTLEIDSDITVTQEFSVKEAVDFISTLNLPKELEVRDYQLKSFLQSIRNKRLMLLSPTASGKSLFLYLVVRYLQTTTKKGILVVPTTSLCYQMFNDFGDYSKNDKDFNVDDEISIIMAGKDKNPKVDRIKVTLENNEVCYFKPNQQLKTKRGTILAKNLSIEDELL